MSATFPARGVICSLLIILSLAGVTTTAVGNAGANPKSKHLAQPVLSTVVALADPASPAESMVVALAYPAPPVQRTRPLAATSAPTFSTPAAPAPARFFTINEVLAKRNGTLSSPSVKLASLDTGQTATDANSYATSGSNRSDEPFGLMTFVAPEGQLWPKWRKVEADIEAEKPILTRCLAETKECSPAAARFGAIIADARELKGRIRIDVVNRRVNAAIRYKSDQEQWGVPDRWSAPLDTDNKGSFNTGFGDCEDYAIAKYIALREAGVPAGDLRLLLVRDNAVRLDHAVLAVRHDGRWLMLDNRHDVLLESKDAWFFTALFALDQQGVKLFAAPYAASTAIHVAATSTPAKTIIPENDTAQANALVPAAAGPFDASTADVFAASAESLAFHMGNF